MNDQFGVVSISNIVVIVYVVNAKAITSPHKERCLLLLFKLKSNFPINILRIKNDEIVMGRLYLLETVYKINGYLQNTIRTEIEYFRNDLDWMYSNANIQRFVYTKRKKVKVSGFRDPDFEKYLLNIGFDVDDGAVTKDTSYLLVPSTSYSSSKTKRANELNVPIVLIQEFRDNVSRYL